MSTTTLRSLMVAAFVAGAFACGGEAEKRDAPAVARRAAPEPKVSPGPAPTEPAPTAHDADAPQAKVALAATIAREIAAAPDEADAILARNGLDRDGLDALMYEIARDPALASAYKEQRMNG
jgi:hypothetical protein